MRKLQYQLITEWQDSVFTKATPLSCAYHLEEEARELREKLENGILDKSEIADCFFMLFGVCNKSGMDYEDITNAINIKFDINRGREWGQPNEKGYVKHKK